MYLSSSLFLKKKLEEIQNDPQIQGILLFAADKSRINTSEMQSILSVNKKPLIGGYFPEIIEKGVRRDSGYLLIYLYKELVVFAIDTNDNERIRREISKFDSIKGNVFCFVNAFWEGKLCFLNNLYNEKGPFVKYLGGGAGSLDFTSFPCVFANQEIIETGGVVGFVENQISIGVSHGWLPITQPLEVTGSKGRVLLSLNKKPAFNVYKSYVEEHSNKQFELGRFFDLAKSYPFGLVRLDNEMLIRDPYAAENGELHLVDEVQVGDYVRVMHGNVDSLLKGAKNALNMSQNNNTSANEKFCINCISRVLYMEHEFEKELYILNKDQEINGILSIGEIANPGNGSLELYNKTVVVAQWKKTN